MAVRDIKINNFDELWCSVALRDFEIRVLSTSFQKIDIGWPPTERVSDISEKCDF